MAGIRVSAAFALVLVLFLGACTRPDPGAEFNDPYEASNRASHEFNKRFDRALLRPTATGYANLTPNFIRGGLANFTEYLRTPRYIGNDLLQGQVDDAVHNSMRLLTNTVFGLGVLDPAADMGLDPRPTGFGDTMAVWGVQEGAYLELPFVGPTTERDFAGRVIDIFTGPISNYFLTEAPGAGVVLFTIDQLEIRNDLGDALDDLLDDSVDSYATTRSVYLQNRRFQLGQEDELEFDPYEDF